MNTSARTMRSEAGFSLIELMIVVAIIGILATIAIPNFNRFQAKAKQSEAKTQLAAIMGAEKGFYAEWNQYYGDFRDIGFQPEGRLNYHVGFAGAGAAPGLPFVNNLSGTGAAGTCRLTGTGAALQANCNFTFQPVSQAPAFAAVGAVGCGQVALTTTPSTTRFTATAIGKISDNPSNDIWSINEANILCNNTIGI